MIFKDFCEGHGRKGNCNSSHFDLRVHSTVIIVEQPVYHLLNLILNFPDEALKALNNKVNVL